MKSLLIRFEDRSYVKKGAVEKTPRYEYDFLVPSPSGALVKTFSFKEPLVGLSSPVVFGKFSSGNLETELREYFEPKLSRRIPYEVFLSFILS